MPPQSEMPAPRGVGLPEKADRLTDELENLRAWNAAHPNFAKADS